jgi:hypothetical protein
VYWAIVCLREIGHPSHRPSQGHSFIDSFSHPLIHGFTRHLFILQAKGPLCLGWLEHVPSCLTPLLPHEHGHSDCKPRWSEGKEEPSLLFTREHCSKPSWSSLVLGLSISLWAQGLPTLSPAHVIHPPISGCMEEMLPLDKLNVIVSPCSCPISLISICQRQGIPTLSAVQFANQPPPTFPNSLNVMI